MKTLNEIIDKAKRDFQNRLKIENPGSAETIAHEVAKNSIPSSSKEILMLAARNLDLALAVPAKGPAFDGTYTAINLLAANIREMVFQALVNPQSPYFSAPSDYPSYAALYSHILQSGTPEEMERTYLELLSELKNFRETFYTKNLYEGSEGNE